MKALNQLLPVLGFRHFFPTSLFSKKTNTIIPEASYLLKMKNLESKIKKALREKIALEKLIHKLLPPSTVRELQNNGKVKPRVIENVTVVFVDIVGYSSLSCSVSVENMLSKIDLLFSAFDNIIREMGLEKIKTMGDGYMFASGVNKQNKLSACRAICASKKMIEETSKVCKLMELENIPGFHIRIGMHTGTVICGVIGKEKLCFDLWGPTVNIAARMESASDRGRINISRTTMQAIALKYPVEYRGKICAKNMDEMDMYFVINRQST